MTSPKSQLVTAHNFRLWFNRWKAEFANANIQNKTYLDTEFRKAFNEYCEAHGIRKTSWHCNLNGVIAHYNYNYEGVDLF
jgi:hypothetical protein